MSGLVSIVGAGPGDPNLITDKGIERLRSAEVVFHDKLSPNELIENFCSGEALVHDVGKRKGKVGPTQQEINERLVEASQGYDRIVRLKGGDPFLFGRGGEETEYLADHDVDFEIIPGVSSLTAVPASAGIPLTHREHSSSVGIVTGHFNRNAEDEQHDWDALAKLETVVVLMGVTRADHVATELIRAGKDPGTAAAVVGWGATPRQESLITTLNDLRDGIDDTGPYLPGLIIVGDVVDCRQTLNWFENRPLFGEKILITRPESQTDRLANQLKEAGAECIATPTIALNLLEKGRGRLLQAFEDIQDYDWLVFTSRNAVRFFFETLEESPHDLRILGSLNTACIGPGTAERLEETGIESDLVPNEHRAEGLTRSLLEELEESSHLLLPRSVNARSYLPETLVDHGHTVDEVGLYRSEPPNSDFQEKLKDLLSTGTADMITFTSSSTVENLFEFIDPDRARDWLRDLDCATIGPITAGTLEDYGIEATVVPDNYNLGEFVDAILDHYRTASDSDQPVITEFDS